MFVYDSNISIPQSSHIYSLLNLSWTNDFTKNILTDARYVKVGEGKAQCAQCGNFGNFHPLKKVFVKLIYNITL